MLSSVMMVFLPLLLEPLRRVSSLLMSCSSICSQAQRLSQPILGSHVTLEFQNRSCSMTSWVPEGLLKVSTSTFIKWKNIGCVRRKNILVSVRGAPDVVFGFPLWAPRLEEGH